MNHPMTYTIIFFNHLNNVFKGKKRKPKQKTEKSKSLELAREHAAISTRVAQALATNEKLTCGRTGSQVERV